MISEGSEFLGRTCAECITWNYDTEGPRKGMISLDRKGNPSKRQGTRTPCFKCPKIPDDAPRTLDLHKSIDHAIEITDATWEAIKYHEECEAVDDWPRNPVTGEVDGIVKRNAGIIKSHKDAARRQEQMTMTAQIMATAGMRLQ